MPTHILVTGGAGFIGSRVAKKYIQSGHRVTVIDNLSTGVEKNIPKGVQFYPLDIRSAELDELFQKNQFDIINHHAAQIDVRKSVDAPDYDAATNILGSIHLLELARKYQIRRFIYISTGGAVYGEPEYLPADENHPVRPLAPYGISKHTVEHYLELYSKLYGLEHIILRYPNVYGPYQNPYGEAGVNAIFIGQMLNGITPVIYGDGEQTRDFVYIDDIVSANLIALDSKNTGIYNLGRGKPISVNQIYQILQKITAYHEPVKYAPARAGEVNHIYLDAAKACNELAWKPKIDFEEGLSRTVRWFAEHPDWYPKPVK